MKVECKFVQRIENEEDIFLVKELITDSNGNSNYNLKILKDKKLPFYVTKKLYRDHKDKKESEDINKLKKYEDTIKNRNKILLYELEIPRTQEYRITNSPFVYGLDVDPRALIKKEYFDTYKVEPTTNTITALDIETDLITEEIIIISITRYKETYVGILKPWLYRNKDYKDYTQELHELYNQYIPKTELNNNHNVEFKFFNNEVDLILDIFNKIDNWKSDFVAIWNINFDIPYILKRLEVNNINPKDIFSSKDIDEKYRYFKYKEGTNHKITASGVRKMFEPQEQWSTIVTSSYSFYIDQMSAYYYIRLGSKKEPNGYSLDSILEKELGKEFKKLKFNNIEADDGLDWHKKMQNDFRLEYIIYNIWDTMCMLELDNKTKDLSVSLSVLSGFSPYDIYNSEPKKILNALYFFYLENNRVLGCKGLNVTKKELLGLSDWILNLDSELIVNNGEFIEEYNTGKNGIRGNVTDLDAVSSYPSDIYCANVSKDTTRKEIIDIEGIDKDIFKRQNINLFFGKVNSIEYCCEMFKFPTLRELKKLI